MAGRASAMKAVVNQASPLSSLGPVGFDPPACALRLIVSNSARGSASQWSILRGARRDVHEGDTYVGAPLSPNLPTKETV